MSVNPFDHPYLRKLLGDEQMADCFSIERDVEAMLRFELALASASAVHGLIPDTANDEIQRRLAGFQADIAILNDAVLNDGVVVSGLIAQMRSHLNHETRPYLHFGATSQDVIDTSLMLRLIDALKLLQARLSQLDVILSDLDRRFGDNGLMGHTRMQAALPMHVRDRLKTWQRPLRAYQGDLGQLLAVGLPLQMGGAVGTLEKFGVKASILRASVAQTLGLTDQEQFHSQRALLIDVAHLFGKITGSLGKIGQDVALLAQDGSEISLSGGGASSAMPHKQNPVAAEVLVAQARFSATLISGLYQSMVHEQERSGAAWTLEWMLLPQIASSCGAATLMALRLLGSVQRIGLAAD